MEIQKWDAKQIKRVVGTNTERSPRNCNTLFNSTQQIHQKCWQKTHPEGEALSAGNMHLEYGRCSRFTIGCCQSTDFVSVGPRYTRDLTTELLEPEEEL